MAKNTEYCCEYSCIEFAAILLAMKKDLFHHGIYGIIQKDEKLLVVLKSRGPYTGSWDLPGGSSESGETPEKTLYREILEETGIRIKQAQFLTQASSTLLVDAKKLLYHTGILYLIQDFDDSELRMNIRHEDVHAAMWIDLSNKNVTMTPFAQKACEELLQFKNQ